METTIKSKENMSKTTAKTEKISGAEALMRCLIEEGVEVMFGYPGGAIMPVYDEIFKYKDRIRHILVRHEQGATHAAEGYARVTNKTGVAIATSGPGATNLITGIADAMIDSTPMVCITGQVASPLLGTDAFQETDIIGISAPVVKWSYQVTDANEIPLALAKAFYIANSGRPGPVLIDITKDAQFQQFDFAYKKIDFIRSYKPTPDLQLEQVKQAAKVINSAKKPFMIVGHGVMISGAQKEVVELAEKANIPVSCTWLGASAFPHDHELFHGMVGMHGNYAPNIKTNECDVLIAVGMRFDDRVTGDLKTYAKQAKIVHIELDAAELHKNVFAHAPVLADAKEALTALNPMIIENKHTEWIQEFKDLYAIEFEKVISEDIHPSCPQLRMAEVVNRLSEITEGKAVVVTDVGQHQMIAARYYKFTDTNANVTSGGLGTMGFCLPAAFGAKIADANRQVVAIIGDGGFQMTIQELGTIFQCNTPVKIIILNNNFLGMVRQWQELFFENRYAETELVNPDFVKIADGYGIPAKRLEDRKDLDSALQTMLNHNGPYLLEVMVEKETNVFPMIPSGASVSDVRLS
jgi:acetolactate synthase-1/2/3 large subunit